MDKQQETVLQQLLQSFADGTLAREDYAVLAEMLDRPDAEALWESFFTTEMDAKDREGTAAESIGVGSATPEDWQKLWEEVQASKERKSSLQPAADEQEEKDNEMPIYNTTKKEIRLRRYAVAVAVMAILLCGGYLLTRMGKKDVPFAPADLPQTAAMIVPGKKGAILHLVDGKRINLDHAREGVIATQNGVQIIKDKGMIKYVGKATKDIYNEISTDLGRQWNFTLPDGSKVWLNAGSSIRYPLAFTGGSRVVEMHGEVYFEVKHDAAKPFKVKVNGQIIEDIGTAFNVNAYADNSATKTTLLEGSIRLHQGQKSVLMKPGDQASVEKRGEDKIEVKRVADPQAVIAWKNGAFQFMDANIEDVMRQMARWYNVEIVYPNKPGFHQFTGKIPNNMDIDDMLKILEQAGVHFKVEALPRNGRTGRIIVSP